MSHYCSGFRLWLWPLWLSLGPSLGNLPSEISTEALARDRMWCRCLWRCCLPLAVLLPLRRACRSPSDAAVSKLPLLHRSRVHLRLSSSVLAVHLHLHGLGSSTSPNGNVLRLATGFVFTPLGTSHVALHCLRLALARVHSACCICAFVLGVELDLAVLFILVVFAIEISLSSPSSARLSASALVALTPVLRSLQSFGERTHQSFGSP